MNKNLPPIQIAVRNEFISDRSGISWGHLIGVRSLQNQALQFSVLLESGALFTGLPAHALCFDENAPKRPLNECQHWDNISSEIDTIQFDTLLYMKCNLKLTGGEIIGGEYLFTVDYVGSSDLSRHPTHWKQFHAIRSNEGNFHLFAQYRIQFTDDALCCDSFKGLDEYKYNEQIWKVGS